VPHERVRYNPYENCYFTTNTGPVASAQIAHLIGGRIYCSHITPLERDPHDDHESTSQTTSSDP
jgi:hypothetical protein